MRRVVSLCLPTWPTDRLRGRLGSAAPPPDAPLVIVGSDGRKRLVTAADSAAQALGLRPGIAATQAHALVPGLIVHVQQHSGIKAGCLERRTWRLPQSPSPQH